MVFGLPLNFTTNTNINSAIVNDKNLKWDEGFLDNEMKGF